MKRTTLLVAVGILTTSALLGHRSANSQTVTNGSFEANSYSTFPGYASGNGGAITGWTITGPTRVGLNPAGGSPFADNGAIPNGANVAFVQNSAGTGTLAQTISGLTIGQTYRLSFYYNDRTGADARANVTMDATTLLLTPSTFGEVGGTNPYYYSGSEFTAAATSATLTFANNAPSGDSTLVFDNVKIATADSNGLTTAAWTNDADSAVSANWNYKAAANFGAAASPVINGVTFTGTAAINPSGTGYSTSGLPSGPFTGDTNTVTGNGGGSGTMASTFVYGSNTTAETVTFSGLVTGRQYVASFYTVGFENGNRNLTMSDGAGGSATINQDVFGDNNGLRLSYTYTATGATQAFSFTPQVNNTTLHMYGVSNRQNFLGWDGATGDWFTASNWDAVNNTVTPTSSLDTVIDNGGTAQVSSGVAAAKTLTVGGSTGGTLEYSAGTISVPSIALDTNGTFRAANSATQSFGVQLTGVGAVQKTNTGTLNITNTNNTYTGETDISGGILNVASLSDYGVASSLGARTAGQETNVGNGIGIHLNGGTLQYTGSTAQSTNREIRIINGASATIDASGSNPAATLSFTHTGANINLFDTTGTRTLTLTGTNTGNNLFAITLTDQSTNATSLTKSGSGTWQLTAANTYSGNTTVSGGVLDIAGAGSLYSAGNTGAGTLSVSSGATVKVSSTANNALGYGTHSWTVAGTINVTGGSANTIPTSTILNGGTLTSTTGNASNGAFFAGATGGSITANGVGNVISSVDFGIQSGTSLTLSTPLAGDVLSASTVFKDIGGAGSLTKTGLGTLNLSGPSTFTGVVDISAGIVNVANFSNYGVAGGLGARTAGQEVAAGNGVGIHLNGGTLQYTGSTAQSTNREIRMINGTSPMIDASGSNPAATLSFTHTGANVNLFDTSGTRTLTLTGSNTGNNLFAITLTDQAANATSLSKTGTGTWVVSGTNTYTGATTITGGVLKNGSASTFTASNTSLAMSGTGTFDLNGFNASVSNVTASAATNTITNSGSADATLTLTNSSATFSALLTDGPSNKLALAYVNAISGTPVALNSLNTFSGGITLLNQSPSGTRMRISTPITTVGSPGAITSGTFGRGAITIGTAATDKAQILFDTVGGNTLMNDLVFNTALGTDVAGGIRLDTTGNILSGKITANLANAAFNTNGAGVSATVSGQVVGPNGVAKLGAGTIFLTNNASTYTGETRIEAGTLNVSSVSDYGVASSIGARLAAQETNVGDGIGIHLGLGTAGATLQYTGSTAQSTNRELRLSAANNTIDASGTVPGATLSFTHTGANVNLFDTGGARTLTLTGSNTGANTFAISLSDAGGNTSLTKTGLGRWVLTGASTYGGNTNIQQGILQIENSAALGAGGFAVAPKTTISNGAALHLNGSLALTEHIHLQGAGPDGLGAIRSLAGTSSISTDMALDASTTIGVDSGSQLTIAAAIYPDTGTQSLTKVGAGTLVLSGGTANTYGGNTTVNGGVLLLSKTAGIDAISAGAINVNAGATLRLGASSQINDAGISSFAITGGTFDLQGFTEGVTPKITLAGGTITGTSAGFVLARGGYEGTGANAINEQISVRGTDANSGLFNIISGTTTVNAAIVTDSGGAQGVTKTGAGTLVFSGGSANTYAGNTAVNDGVLLLQKTAGVNAIAGNVTVGDGVGTDTLRLGATDQIASTSVVTVNGPSAGNSGKFELNGFNETVGGIASGGAFAVIQVNESGPAANSTLTVNTTADRSYSGILRNDAVNAGSVLTLNKSGAGFQLLLDGASNSYSGGTNIANSGGWIRMGNSAALGTGAVNVGSDANVLLWFNTGSATVTNNFVLNGLGANFSGGAKDAIYADGGGGGFANYTISGNITLNANSDIGGNTANNLHLTGQITGTGGFSKGSARADENNTLFVEGTNNSYSGVTTFTKGAVNVANLSNYGVNGSLGNRTAGQETNVGDGIGLHFAGGTLQYTGSTPQSTNREIRISTAGGTIDASGSNSGATLSFTHTGANVNLFDTPGARTLTLTGSNTGANTFAISLGDAGGVTGLTKTGAGRWVLTGASTYGGQTLIQQGILQIENSAALGSGAFSVAALTIISNGAALHLNGNLTVPEHIHLQGVGPDSLGAIRSLSGTSSLTNHISLDGATTIGVNGGSQLTISGQIYDNVAFVGNTLTKLGAGTLTLSHPGTFTTPYSGATLVQQGTLEVTVNGALGGTNGDTTVSSGARLLLTNTSYTTTEALNLNGSGIGAVGTDGALYATGTSRWDGNITAQSNATIFVPTGSTLALGNSGSPGVITKNNVTLTFDGGGVTTVNSQITGATDHTSDLDITGGSTVILTNINNNYMGPTNIINGTLQNGLSNVVPNGSELTFGSAGAASTYDLASFSETIRGLSSTAAGNGVVRNSVNATNSTLTLAPQGVETWTFTGAIQQNPGTVNVVMNGAPGATQRLGGVNTYTGATTVTSGTLEQFAGSLQNASITVNGGTFLQSGGTNNVTGVGTGDLTITGAGVYSLTGGTLDFHDYSSGSPTTWTPDAGRASTISMPTGAQFSFTGGTLQDVSTITVADNSAFTQNGGTFVIGQDGTGPAALTTINGGFSLLGGIMRFDAFGPDATPEQCCDGVASLNDQVTVNGDLLLDSTVSLDFVSFTPEFGDAFTLFCADTITLGDNFGIDGGFFRVIPDGQGGFALQAIVPEPASVAVWTIIGLAGAAGAWRLRKRKNEGGRVKREMKQQLI